MTLTQIVFILAGAVLIGAAVLTVTVQKMLHAALWLILTLFSVAVIFILLNNPFFGVVQVLVYIGAIAILMIFAIMLTRRMMYDDSTQFNMQWFAGLIVAVLMFSVLVLTMRMWPGFNVAIQGTPDPQAIQQLGMSLVSPDSYLLPFEIASILLLASLVGAIYISREKNS
jgi:NADH-quinone oxidoreductase subunit J